MATAFHSVNVGLGLSDFSTEATTPTTPRALPTASDRSHTVPSTEGSALTTPTRLSFAGVEGQRPLPRSPFSSSFSSAQIHPPEKTQREELSRGSSERSIHTLGSQDVDMDESDEGDGDGGSDAESIDGETGRPKKKKKGQRFFCTDFPPCNLSFTRSEHLARHIRKHTGERPFQCHCSRRFSRLDNLRQHAQTVHVNEEIPGDSLAATGTRFQRQIRTDRVRPGSGRSRASTASSQGSHGRGHSRNLSASSIGSTASTISRDDGRRRPPPLMMASDPNSRSRLSLDITRAQPSTPPTQYTQMRENSGDISTPTSTTFSNGPNSPGYGSSIGSPVSAASRTMSLWGGNSTHGRRLSVPSGANPFHSPHGSTYPPPYLSPLAPSNSSNFSGNSSMYGSPTSSTYSFNRRDSALAAEAEWRRRTWHPSTYSNYSRPATSGLSYYQTADAPQPAFAPQATQAASQSQRLPGIETFDQISHRPPTPPRGSSPMQVDSPSRPPIYPGPSVQNTSGPNDRRGHASWDMSLHQNLTRLDIAAYGTSPNKDAGLWGQQTLAEIQNAAARPSPSQTNQAPSAGPVLRQEPQKRPAETSYLSATINNRNKRHGWYAGPLAVPQPVQHPPRTSPEDSSSSEGVPTPSFSAPEYHPSIVHSNGYIESNYPPTAAAATQQNYTHQGHTPSAYPMSTDAGGMAASQHGAPKQNDMSGLEVLVAVATSGETAPTAPTH